MKNIGFAITGSFCTHNKILEVLKDLKKDYNIIPIFSESVLKNDTRFGKAKDFLISVEKICENKTIKTLQEAEPMGPQNLIDLLVIAPCTGNTLAKLSNGITDNAVLMTAKSILRNNKPIVVGISTNDGLGISLKNISALLNSKNYYFIPFFQDDPKNKPKSLKADFDLIKQTIEDAFLGVQTQPIIK